MRLLDNLKLILVSNLGGRWMIKSQLGIDLSDQFYYKLNDQFRDQLFRQLFRQLSKEFYWELYSQLAEPLLVQFTDNFEPLIERELNG